VRGPRGREIDPTEMQFEFVAPDDTILQIGRHFGLPDDFPYDRLVHRGNEVRRPLRPVWRPF
jgi:hypothetical protein